MVSDLELTLGLFIGGALLSGIFVFIIDSKYNILNRRQAMFLIGFFMGGVILSISVRYYGAMMCFVGILLPFVFFYPTAHEGRNGKLYDASSSGFLAMYRDGLIKK